MALKKYSFVIALSTILLIPISVGNAASPTPTESSTPDSPTYFRTSALGDLFDLKKDVNDAKIAVSKGGKWKLLGNAAEIAFNVGQLEALSPPTKYASTWSKYVQQLDELSSLFLDSITSGTVSNTNSVLSKMTSQIKKMESYVKKVK
jgi:hypothetical protein